MIQQAIVRKQSPVLLGEKISHSENNVFTKGNSELFLGSHRLRIVKVKQGFVVSYRNGKDVHCE